MSLLNERVSGALESAIMANSVLFCQCKIFKSQDSDFDALCTPQELKKIKTILRRHNRPMDLGKLGTHIVFPKDIQDGLCGVE